MIGKPSLNPITKQGEVTFLVDDLSQVLSEIETLKDKKIRVLAKEYHKKRTLSMNAYFWVLLTEVAKRLKTDSESIHRRYVRDHAFVWTDEDHKPVAIAMIDKVDVDTAIPGYWKAYGERRGNLIQYIRIKGTSEMDTREMSIIIDDLIEEAKSLGIQTATPEEIASMKAMGIDL